MGLGRCPPSPMARALGLPMPNWPLAVERAGRGDPSGCLCRQRPGSPRAARCLAQLATAKPPHGAPAPSGLPERLHGDPAYFVEERKAPNRRNPRISVPRDHQLKAPLDKLRTAWAAA
jgi:hypothetical protein